MPPGHLPNVADLGPRPGDGGSDLPGCLPGDEPQRRGVRRPDLHRVPWPRRGSSQRCRPRSEGVMGGGQLRYLPRDLLRGGDGTGHEADLRHRQGQAWSDQGRRVHGARRAVLRAPHDRRGVRPLPRVPEPRGHGDHGHLLGMAAEPGGKGRADLPDLPHEPNRGGSRGRAGSPSSRCRGEPPRRSGRPLDHATQQGVGR